MSIFPDDDLDPWLVRLARWIDWQFRRPFHWMADVTEQPRDRLRAWWHGWERVNDVEPSDALPCESCGKVKHTTVSSVWCNAEPKGRRVRMCKDCGSMCAGG